MMNLKALREDSGRAVRRLLEGLELSSEASILVRDVQELCLHFHIIAVATLLVDGKPQGFFLNLCRAAENWRRLLSHLRREGAPLPASKHHAPLLGALAAGHWTLARQVAELSEIRWLPEEEYRTEYTWSQALQALATSEAAGQGSALVPHVEALEVLGGEDMEDRALMVRAMVESNEPEFAKAFAHAALVRQEVIEKRAKLFTTPVTKFAPQRYLWLEGLALLRLAERAGFPMNEEHYLYCPPLARLPMTESYRGDWVIPLAP